MAYEYGTMHMSSDSKSNPTSGHVESDAVMLIVYKEKGAACQQVALTMYPLEQDPTASTCSTRASPEEQAIRNAIQKGDFKHADYEYFWSGRYEKPLIGKGSTTKLPKCWMPPHPERTRP